jgi:hypothetical protein
MEMNIKQQEQAPDGNHLDEMPWFARKESDSSHHNFHSLTHSLNKQIDKRKTN